MPVVVLVVLKVAWRSGTMRAGPVFPRRRECPLTRPEDPFALNLARIVHRLMTNPRGWQIDRIKAELGIADRTYRKYRRTIQEQFAPLRDRRGRSLVREVRDGDAAFLRLVDGGEVGVDNPDLVSSMAAVHLARQAFRFLGETGLKKALDDMEANLRERVGDKRFVLGHLFRNLDRMLHTVPDAPKDYSRQGRKLREILTGLIFTRVIKLDYSGPSGQREHEVEPMTLMMHRSALYLVARHVGGTRPYTYAVDRIASVTATTKAFSYPTSGEYDPEAHFKGAFGIFLVGEKERRPTDVELVFANERWLKLYVKERSWHPSQKFRELKDGRLQMRFRVDTMVEVWPWIRSFGEAVEVVKPELGVSVRRGGTRAGDARINRRGM